MPCRSTIFEARWPDSSGPTLRGGSRGENLQRLRPESLTSHVTSCQCTTAGASSIYHAKPDQWLIQSFAACRVVVAATQHLPIYQFMQTSYARAAGSVSPLRFPTGKWFPMINHCLLQRTGQPALHMLCAICLEHTPCCSKYLVMRNRVTALLNQVTVSMH